ncbi:MAG TPA: dienelactone hydrolase family protein [Thermoanaerobaculia bacterium]|nr:dienelactone hydrolase family protein [Thermoanaerobaculia bacterium]
MAITERTVDYHDGDLRLEGWLARDDAARSPVPGVLVAHTWAGRGAFEQSKARALAELGYAGMALDLYGEGKLGSGPEENRGLMQPFLDDRALLRRRMLAAVEALRAVDGVDARRVAAIGFCFGGLCALDLARTGVEVRGVVSFHGLLQPPPQPAETVRAKVLVLHGADDPWVSADEVASFQREMTAAGADWQLHSYGGTLHAFTNPAADNPEAGAQYSESADRRSWRTLVGFLDEVF